MRLFKRKPQAPPVKPMGIRSTVLPPKPPASFNEWVAERERENFDRVWRNFKAQIQTPQNQEPMSQSKTEEEYRLPSSDCCGAETTETDLGICPECGEHCEFDNDE